MAVKIGDVIIMLQCPQGKKCLSKALCIGSQHHVFNVDSEYVAFRKVGGTLTCAARKMAGDRFVVLDVLERERRGMENALF